jgi:hypothetical protein
MHYFIPCHKFHFASKEIEDQKSLAKATAGKQQDWKLSLIFQLHVSRTASYTTPPNAVEAKPNSRPKGWLNHTLRLAKQWLKSLLEPNKGSATPELQDWGLSGQPETQLCAERTEPLAILQEHKLTSNPSQPG